MIESGAAVHDQLRDTARKMNFLALIGGLQGLLGEDEELQSDYEAIPENQKLFYDLVLRNCEMDGYDSNPVDIGLLVEEIPDKESYKLLYRYKVKEIGDLSFHHGLVEHEYVRIKTLQWPAIDQLAEMEVTRNGDLIFTLKNGEFNEEH